MKKDFTTAEKARLELPISKKEWTDPEDLALLKIVDAMPWLLEVADYKFDPYISKLIMQREGDADEQG